MGLKGKDFFVVCSDTVAAQSIIRMMRLTPNFDWQQYEQFHAEWEVMKRALLLGKEVSVLDF